MGRKGTMGYLRVSVVLAVSFTFSMGGLCFIRCVGASYTGERLTVDRDDDGDMGMGVIWDTGNNETGSSI